MSHSGATDNLRRQLFPVGFAGEVMLLAIDTWRSFSMHHSVKHEEPITALFRDALIEAYDKAGRKWFVTLEDPVTDPDFGTELGRNDIRFYPPEHHRQTVYFTLECKRLRVRTKSKFSDLADKYVVEGVQRFVDGRYSAGLPCGGMIGYVMDGDVPTALQGIQDEMHAQRQALMMPATNSTTVPSLLLPKYQWSVDTNHDRTDGRFTVHHALVDIEGRRQKSPSGS